MYVTKQRSQMNHPFPNHLKCLLRTGTSLGVADQHDARGVSWVRKRPEAGQHDLQHPSTCCCPKHGSDHASNHIVSHDSHVHIHDRYTSIGAKRCLVGSYGIYSRCRASRSGRTMFREILSDG
ncbi:hypothetical protein H257_17570 [Aphanomyces astaci]|uniref:Uncharacterized protein n=1 Tax=Aphanomyces astaci TaxID=112090 RepID=W4FGG8_APHAT|nr:hypothetical protein H257_17570 [Aphanomyces astaci]ETV65848.1 hypothetical protein H257_17570 [Aphanomyces astaci]|eukprot:XP_009844711.1 hypothetical protein H257_17570 [Aphanomyces astaci]